jgi:hypothetical protein
MTETGEIVDRLEAIAEHLSELALSELRQAVEQLEPGEKPHPALLAEERRFTRARRAVEKAISVLQQPSKGIEAVDQLA